MFKIGNENETRLDPYNSGDEEQQWPIQFAPTTHQQPERRKPFSDHFFSVDTEAYLAPSRISMRRLFCEYC